MAENDEWIDRYVREAKRLTRELLPEQDRLIYVGLPMMCGGDSVSVDIFLVDVWADPVTTDTLQAFGFAYRDWYFEQEQIGESLT